MTHSRHAHSRSRQRSLSLHRWHRRTGVLAGLFVIWMVVSGLLLNHTADLGLAKRVTRNALVTGFYGLEFRVPGQGYVDGTHWLADASGAPIVDGRKIDAAIARPVGFAAGNGMLFIADPSQLLVVAFDGTLIDKLSSPALPVHAITRAGAGCGGVAVEGEGRTLATRDGTEWHACIPADVRWSAPKPLTAEQMDIEGKVLTPGISWERFLQDAHSGRLLGPWGPYAVDIASLGLVFLAASGWWMYARQRRLKRRDWVHVQQ